MFVNIPKYTFCGFADLRCDRLEDDADVLRQRLVQALVVPTVAKGGHASDEQPALPHPEMAWKKSSTEFHLLDVAQLSLAQRVVVQLNGVGVFAVGGKVCSGEGAQHLFCIQSSHEFLEYPLCNLLVAAYLD